MKSLKSHFSMIFSFICFFLMLLSSWTWLQFLFQEINLYDSVSVYAEQSQIPGSHMVDLHSIYPEVSIFSYACSSEESPNTIFIPDSPRLFLKLEPVEHEVMYAKELDFSLLFFSLFLNMMCIFLCVKSTRDMGVLFTIQVLHLSLTIFFLKGPFHLVASLFLPLTIIQLPMVMVYGWLLFRSEKEKID